MHKTPESKLAGRYTAHKTAEEAVTAIAAAQASIEAFKNAEELREKMDSELSKLSPDVAKMIRSQVGNTEENFDKMRLNVADAFFGIRSQIVNSLKGDVEPKSVLSYDVNECRKLLAVSNDLFKTFAKMFPSKTVSN